MSRSRIWPISRVSTTRSPPSCRSARAIALERRDREYEERYRQLGVEDDLASLEGLTPGMLVTLGENGIKTLDDFAGLAGDELVEMLGGSDKGGAALELGRGQRADHGGPRTRPLVRRGRQPPTEPGGGEGVEATAFHVEQAAAAEAATGRRRLPHRRSAAASPPARCAIAPGCCALSSDPTGRSCPISTSGSPDGVCG